MGLVGNFQRNRLNSFRSGFSITMSPSQKRQCGEWVNWTMQCHAATGLDTAAHPTGYVTGAAYLPRTGGEMSFRSSGASTLTGSMLSGRLMIAPFTGSGTLTADGALISAMVVALTGGGSIVMEIAGRYNMTIDITASGDLAATAYGTGHMAADLSGSGDIDALISAFGDMSVDIVVTGTGLSTANVGQSVWGAIAAANNEAGSMGEQLNNAGAGGNPWDTIIESGYTADEVMRILLAVAAGKTTVTSLGGGAATVVFRDQADTKDRVAVDMQDSDRETVTLDPS